MAAFLHDVSLKGQKAQKVMNFLHEMGKGASSQSHGMALDSLKNESKGQSETTRLKEAIKKLEAEKEAGLAQFYKLLKKASCLESRVISAEEESIVLKEQACRYEVEKFRSLEKIVHERFSHEIEKSVVMDFVEGIAYKADQILVKNVVLETEKESLISQVKELRELIEGLKRELGDTLDANEALVLEKSVLVWLFRELKIEAKEAEEERKALLENFNNESLKVLTLETEAEYLNLILKKNEDERIRHEEKLNVEFSVLQESYHNLQTLMAKVVEENTVLKKGFTKLKQENHALTHQSEMQLHELHETEATHTHENSIEVLNCRKEFQGREAQIYPEATDVHRLKEPKLDRIITVEKTVDYMKRYSAADAEDTEIKHNKAKTLAEEFRFQCSYTLDDHRRICTIQHCTQPKTHFGMKVSAPKLGLKKSSSKASSVNSDTKFDDDLEMEHEREKKHKNRISEFGKKFLPKKYQPKSRQVTHQGEQESKNKGF